jgi:hypothetical protein
VNTFSVRMSLYVLSQLNGHPGLRRQVRMQNVTGGIDRGVLLSDGSQNNYLTLKIRPLHTAHLEK